MRPGEKKWDFGNLIPGKLCNLNGHFAFWREMLALLRDKLLFLRQKCIRISQLTMEGSFDDISGIVCFVPGLFVYLICFCSFVVIFVQVI